MANQKRKGLKVGTRAEFVCIADIIPGHEEALRKLLNQATADPRIDEAIAEIGTLHEARFVILDGGKRLLFASSFDGDWDKYIDDFAATVIGKVFGDTWVHTQGFPGIKSPKVKDWFQEHTIEAGSYTAAYPATVKEVLKALAVEHAFEQVLDNPAAAEALKHPALKPLLEIASAA